MIRFVLILAALPFPIFSGIAHASCSTMQAIAQRSAHAAAARNNMGEHQWFYAHGRQRGALAENLAPTGSKATAMHMWRASPGHASNIALRGPRFACKQVAIACNGRNCFAAMEIGPTDRDLRRGMR